MKFGLLGMLPGIAAIVGGWCGGLLSDSLVRRGYSLPIARKIPLVGGMLGSSVIGIAAYSPPVTLPWPRCVSPILPRLSLPPHYGRCPPT
nr:hypothetical protein [Sodalis ligni]